MSRKEIISAIASIGLVAIVSVGVLERIWKLGTVLDLVPFIGLAAVPAVLAWGYRDRIEKSLVPGHRKLVFEHIDYRDSESRWRLFFVLILPAEQLTVLAICFYGAITTWQFVGVYGVAGYPPNTTVPILTYLDAADIGLFGLGIYAGYRGITGIREIIRARKEMRGKASR